MVRIAVLGAGRMGLPIVRALARAGHPVSVSDTRPEVADDVRAAGATWSPGLPELLGTNPAVLLTVLPGTPELQAIIDDVLTHTAGHFTWIELTSAAPDLGPQLAEKARPHGVTVLEAPMSGGPAAAADGAVTLYVGGDPALLDQHRALLGTFASTVHHCGPSGAGYLTKLLINQLWFGQAVAVTEALLLGRANGLAPDALAGLLADSPAASAFLTDYASALLAGDHLPSFGLDRIVEELDSLERTAAASGVPTPVAGAVAQLHREALRHFGPQNGELLGPAYLRHLAYDPG